METSDSLVKHMVIYDAKKSQARDGRAERWNESRVVVVCLFTVMLYANFTFQRRINVSMLINKPHLFPAG